MTSRSNRFRAAIVALSTVACLISLGTLPAAADDAAFKFGRLVSATPDAHGRVGVRVVCLAQAGCNLELILTGIGTKPIELGRVYTQLIGGSTEINYVMLSKSRQRTLARHKTLAAKFIANVTVPKAGVATYSKPVTLKAPKPRTKR